MRMALVTSLDAEILSLGQLYRDRGDAENDFDELKNQWGWGGFTTQDLKRCRLMARFVALVFNWWTLFVRLADPNHHREAITSRPLLLSAIGRRTTHAGQTTIRVGSTHGKHAWVRSALTRIGLFLEAFHRRHRHQWHHCRRHPRCRRQLSASGESQPADAAG